ncbi:MAG: hypothetical protein ACI97N_000937 [Cognaticolwellia sp.]|jgi:hypothetical protein
MNKLLILLTLIGLCFFQCSPDENVQGFEINYFREFEIFAGLNTFDTHNFQLPGFDAEYESFLTINGKTRENITQIIPKAFRITNVSGNITFGDLQRVRLFMTKTDGTLEREIAFLEPIPANIGYQIDLVPTLATVKEIIESGDFVLTLKLNYRSIPQQSIDARLNVVFQAVTE